MGDRSFDAGWLALREPIDHRSRNEDLITLLRDHWRGQGWCRVLDLGSGTGSNLRYLAPRLPGGQEWTLLDHDGELLSAALAPDPSVRTCRVRGELTGEGLDAVERAELVTASALLDLVSAEWLGAMIEACRRASCGVLLTLTYDGTIRWAEGEPGDDAIRAAVNAHQRGDKGSGPALGPRASEVAEARLREAGYRTWLRPSPWRLGPDDARLAEALVDGWAMAAGEQWPERSREFRAWARRRRGTIASGRFRLVVGHRDLLALPPLR